MSQKNQTFMDMLKSAKAAHDEDEEEEEEDFVLKKEPSPHLRSIYLWYLHKFVYENIASLLLSFNITRTKNLLALTGDLTVKVGGWGGKINYEKPNTPRSKHSATEQRRRSKINDRHVHPNSYSGCFQNQFLNIICCMGFLGQFFLSWISYLIYIIIPFFL